MNTPVMPQIGHETERPRTGRIHPFDNILCHLEDTEIVTEK